MEERSIYVSSSSRYNPDFRTISAACEALNKSSPPSSTPTHIYIITGRYVENITIRSNVNLVATGTVVIEGKLIWHVGKNKNKSQSGLIESVALRGIQLIGELEVVVDNNKDGLCPTSLFVTSCHIIGSISLTGRSMGSQDMVLFDKCTITAKNILQTDYEVIFESCTVDVRRQHTSGTYIAPRLAISNSEYSGHVLISTSSVVIIRSRLAGMWIASASLLTIEDSSSTEDSATIDITTGSLVEAIDTVNITLISSDRTGGWNPSLLNIPFKTASEGNYTIPIKPPISSLAYDVIRTTGCQVLELRREEIVVHSDGAGEHDVLLSYTKSKKTKSKIKKD